jgi:PII-like signaling protein
MRNAEITIMRIYLTEGERQLNRLLSFLKETEEVRGLTVFRGISGFGPSGEVHVSSLTDLSLDLPLVIEMFDEPGKMQRIYVELCKMLKPGHIVMWAGKTNIDGISD